MWAFGDVWWPATVVLFGPRWLFLLPAIPLSAGALLVRRRLLLPVALGTIMALGPLMGFTTGWRRWISPSTPRSLRLITFNVEGNANTRLESIPSALGAYNADVIVMQECVTRLIDAGFWPPGWTARQSEGGLCFATRFPVLRVEALRRVETGTQGGTGNAVLLWLDAGSDTVAVAAIHLETPRKGLSSLRNEGSTSRMPVSILVREVGARRVSRWIRSSDPAPIIAGDFNMPVESRIYRESFSECANSFSAVGTGFGWTRVLRRFSVRIDHVLACDGWRPLHIEIGPSLGSDHRPVIVDLARIHPPRGTPP